MPEIVTVTASITAIREALADARAILPHVETGVETIERALIYADIAADGAERLHAEVERLRARVAELESQRNHINDLPPSKQTLAALKIMRRPIRRKHQDGGERREA